MRTVARPVANLGNTCYMNAVLQALAHAPELCLAMDCEAHRSSCPVAAENKERLRRSSSSESSASSRDSDSQRPRGTRKSRRSGRNSPPEQLETSPNAMKFCALCELEEHLQSVHDSSLRDKPVAPENFVNGFIEQVAPWFKLGVQEDSHEFLRLLIDAMQKSCEKARDRKPTEEVSYKKQGTGRGGRISTRSRVFSDTSSPRSSKIDSSTVQDGQEYPFSLFRGTVESTVTCGSCGAASSTLDPIEDIGLEVAAPVVPTSRSGTERSSRNVSPVPSPTLYDVETAFGRFSQPETLDSGYKCEKCSKVGRATKQSKLASIPPILTLHLKRFRYGGGSVGVQDTKGSRSTRSELGQLLASSDLYGKSGSAKIEGHVKFNVLFDLKPFLTQELQDKHGGNMLCRLFAVIVHAGKNSHSGHYIAYVRHLTKNEWWKMDDGRVTLVSMDELLRAEAYMLFYRVMQHPVATKLEREYKVKIETKPPISLEEKIADSRRFDMINNILRTSNRKRAMESSSDSEEWVRCKTKMPPHLLNAVRKIEEMVSDDPMFLPDFIRRIVEELGDEGITAVKDYSKAALKGKRIKESDVVGGCDKHSAVIFPAIWEVARWIEKQTGSTAEDWLCPPTKTVTSLDVNVPETRVAVVEPEEEMDLL